MKPTGFLGQPFKKLKTHHEDPGPGPSSSNGAQSAPGNGHSAHSAHRPHINFSDSDDSDEEEKYVDRAALLREIDADLQSIISRPGPSDDDKKPVVKKEEAGAGVVGAGAATQTRLPSPAESTQLKPAQQPASAVHVWPSAVQEEAATQTKLPPLSSQLKPAQQPASAVQVSPSPVHAGAAAQTRLPSPAASSQL